VTLNGLQSGLRMPWFDAEQNTQAAPPVERDDTSNVATPWATVTEGAAPLSTARAGEVRTALMRIGPETAPIHWTGRGRGTTLFRVGAKGAICLILRDSWLLARSACITETNIGNTYVRR